MKPAVAALVASLAALSPALAAMPDAAVPDGTAGPPASLLSPAERAEAETRADEAPAAADMTRALNLLEAQGYGDFTDFRRDGGHFTVSVVRNGRPTTLAIDPASGRITPLPR